MKGVRRLQFAAGDPLAGQLFAQATATASFGPETTQLRGPFTAARAQLFAQERREFLLGQRDGEHRAARQRLHQPPAHGEKMQRVFAA